MIGADRVTERDEAAAKGAATDGWSLVRDMDGASAAHHETLFALSDGWLGVRATLEECPGASGSAFIAEAYERRPIDYHERFPGFPRCTDTRTPVADGKRVVVRVGDAGVALWEGEILSGRRTLNLATGRLRRVTDWRAPGGGRLQVVAERVACIARPGLFPLRFTLTALDFEGDVSLTGEIEASAMGAAKSDDPRIGVGAGALPLIDRLSLGTVEITVQAIASRGLAVLCGQSVNGETHGRLARGESLCLEKRVAYAVCAHEPAAIDAAAAGLAARLEDAAAVTFEALAGEQEGCWRDFWDVAAVSIIGSRDLELALRLNLFHLRQAADASGANGLAAKGLTGEGYEGHVFWDAEIFMIPALVHTEPALARAHLAWRVHHLEGARGHAREMNFPKGALYPWRTIGGEESSSYFPAGSAQLHINADIAHAVGLYLDATDDVRFLMDGGAELVFETARIWPQAGFFDPRRDDAFSICAVTGPDEYTALVDNNFYTNLMARAHLRLAGRIAGRLEAEAPDVFRALEAQLGLEPEERALWARAAEAMLLPYDNRLGVHAQDDQFLGRPRFDFAGATGEGPLLLRYHPLTLYRHQVCKQADVVLALVLKSEAISLERKRRDFDYYEPITTHDSTLSCSAFAMLAAEVGYPETALRFFGETALVDLENRHDNTHHGAHMAAMAGSWLALVWGFAGLRTGPGGMTFHPSLPPGLDGYSARIGWRGTTVEIRVDQRAVRYRRLSGPPIGIRHEGEPLMLGDSVMVARPWGRSGPLEAVIFDLDGVLADTATAHYIAWKRLADELGAPFDLGANERLKGVGRAESLDIILALGGVIRSAHEKRALADRKNGYYLEAVTALGAGDLLPGARDALTRCRAMGLKTALASASRNAPRILSQLGIADLFDAVAEVTPDRRGKPAPDLFLAAAEMVGVSPARCLAVEDSRAGLAAIRAAGMSAIGVGDPATLADADLVIPNLIDFQPRRPGPAA
jgi:alpha,alpha-trehalose phosphorylase